MKILAIETSCDETAVAIVEGNGGLEHPVFKVLGNALFSQIDIHKEYGGVYPMIAKREHAKKLPMLIKKVLIDTGMYIKDSNSKFDLDEKILEREEGLYEGLKRVLEGIKKPELDVISVTSGPGLEPALWVGINCAMALGKLWNIPVVPANHMEGHIVSVLVENADTRNIEFPALALLISGGHTEIVEIADWGNYKILGQTLDDAVGEAFDKAARMLGLPYPGGPEISKLAELARQNDMPHIAHFPRPMIHSDNLNFSFSGLKTAVLYYIRDKFKVLTENDRADIAREFEDAAVDVLKEKTERALAETGAKTLIIAGGVIANKKLRETFSQFTHVIVKIPTLLLSTDNALMIASAAYIRLCLYPELLKKNDPIIAKGNLRLE